MLDSCFEGNETLDAVLGSDGGALGDQHLAEKCGT